MRNRVAGRLDDDRIFAVRFQSFKVSWLRDSGEIRELQLSCRSAGSSTKQCSECYSLKITTNSKEEEMKIEEE